MNSSVKINVEVTQQTLICVVNPFQRMRTWRDSNEFQKPGSSLRPGPEVVKRKKFPKSEWCKGGRTSVQNEKCPWSYSRRHLLILLILEKQEFNRRLSPLQRRGHNEHVDEAQVS